MRSADGTEHDARAQAVTHLRQQPGRGPTVRHTVGWRAVCSCGLRGPRQDSMREAMNLAAAHLTVERRR